MVLAVASQAQAKETAYIHVTALDITLALCVKRAEGIYVDIRKYVALTIVTIVK